MVQSIDGDGYMAADRRRVNFRWSRDPSEGLY